MRLPSWCLLVALAVALSSGARAASDAAFAVRRAVPIVNPSHNIASPLLSYSTGSCGGDYSNCASPCSPSLIVKGGRVVFPLSDTPACTDLVLSAINAAQRAEHARQIVLPTNYYGLSAPEQLFVLVNLERISRGIPPLVGLVAYLDHVARAGAVEGADPVITSMRYDPDSGDFQAGPLEIANHYEGGTSIWAGDDANPAAAVFGWMYDDGWGGSRKATVNLVCTSVTAAACWGHRDNILGDIWGTSCATCLAGSGYASSRALGAWSTSFAMIFLEPAAPVATSFAWNSQVLSHLPAAERVRAA